MVHADLHFHGVSPGDLHYVVGNQGKAVEIRQVAACCFARVSRIYLASIMQGKSDLFGGIFHHLQMGMRAFYLEIHRIWALIAAFYRRSSAFATLRFPAFHSSPV